eukprot:4783062-Lingulodinium_polyedra.AAC.1
MHTSLALCPRPRLQRAGRCGLQRQRPCRPAAMQTHGVPQRICPEAPAGALGRHPPPARCHEAPA